MECNQCGSNDIVRNVRAIDMNDSFNKNLRLEVYEDPNALLFRGTYEAELKANICANCGFVMWFVSKGDAAEMKRIKNRKK